MFQNLLLPTYVLYLVCKVQYTKLTNFLEAFEFDQSYGTAALQ